MGGMSKSLTGKVNQERGETAEIYVATTMRGMGFVAVEKIQTGWKVIWKNHRPVSAWPIEKVMGDIRALMPDGRGVLVEVKDRRDKLIFSDLKKHQVEALNIYADNGAVALLAWVADSIYIMQWPITGFGPRKSLTPQQASQLAIVDISQIE